MCDIFVQVAPIATLPLWLFVCFPPVCDANLVSTFPATHAFDSFRLRSFLWERAVPAVVPGGTEPSVLKTEVPWPGSKPVSAAAEQALRARARSTAAGPGLAPDQYTSFQYG